MRWEWRIGAIALIFLLALFGGLIHQAYDASQCPYEPLAGDKNSAGFMGACSAEYAGRMFWEGFALIALVLGTAYWVLDSAGALASKTWDRLVDFVKAKVKK